jgi:hypothetical protein
MHGAETSIQSYSFGRMDIAGREYTSDLILYPDGRVQDSWWRESGHSLTFHDIEDLVASQPEIIVAGTGAIVIMAPVAGLSDRLEKMGIEFRAEPTGEAVRLFNELSGQRKTGGCFHLTC